MITPSLFLAGVLVIATSLDRLCHNDRVNLVMVVLTRFYFAFVFADEVGIW